MAGTYTVVDGDNPTRISVKVYNGNPNRWRAILDLNHIRDPRVLTAGMILYLP